MEYLQKIIIYDSGKIVHVMRIKGRYVNTELHDLDPEALREKLLRLNRPKIRYLDRIVYYT